jgi:RNA polymerase sigma-70 factor (ECF subfamily)
VPPAATATAEVTMFDAAPDSSPTADTADITPAVVVNDRATRRRFQQEAMPHGQALFGAAMRLTRSPDDAKDLVQETMFKAWRAFHTFESGTNCKAWLFRILTNTFINKYRRKAKERDILEGTNRIDAEHEMVNLPSKRAFLDPEGAMADKSLADEVIAALDSVPADFRAVVILSDIEGFAYKDIADMVGIPVGTVMSRLFRGRRLLQDKLFGYAVETGVLHPTLDAAREGKTEPLSLAAYRQRRARTA